MSDISKCSGDDCPLQTSCWRFLAPAAALGQTWLAEVPYDPLTQSCEHYWRTGLPVLNGDVKEGQRP